jgi:hypothetical protein
VDTPYIFHSQRIVRPASSGPPLPVNQNRVVTAGSTKARKTSVTAFRISISILTIGDVAAAVLSGRSFYQIRFDSVTLNGWSSNGSTVSMKRTVCGSSA